MFKDEDNQDDSDLKSQLVKQEVEVKESKVECQTKTELANLNVKAEDEAVGCQTTTEGRT